MRTILVAVDGTDASSGALRQAVTLAHAFGTALVVVAVVPTVAAAARGVGPVDPIADGPSRDALIERARAVVDGVPGGVGVLHVEYVVAVGPPAKVIVAVADSRDADLIVLGEPPLSWPRHLLGQSIGTGVLRRTKRDVLLIRNGWPVGWSWSGSGRGRLRRLGPRRVRRPRAANRMVALLRGRSRLPI